MGSTRVLDLQSPIVIVQRPCCGSARAVNVAPLPVPARLARQPIDHGMADEPHRQALLCVCIKALRLPYAYVSLFAICLQYFTQTPVLSVYGDLTISPYWDGA